MTKENIPSPPIAVPVLKTEFVRGDTVYWASLWESNSEGIRACVREAKYHSFDDYEPTKALIDVNGTGKLQYADKSILRGTKAEATADLVAKLAKKVDEYSALMEKFKQELPKPK